MSAGNDNPTSAASAYARLAEAHGRLHETLARVGPEGVSKEEAERAQKLLRWILTGDPADFLDRSPLICSEAQVSGPN